MAASLAAGAARRVAACLLAGALAGLAHGARGEVLIDPTRSPLGAPGPDSAVAPVPATRLQMILRGPGETRTALIDGAAVRVGDTVHLPAGAARVEHITDTTVVLARGPARETLYLLPGLARAVQCTKRAGVQRRDGC